MPVPLLIIGSILAVSMVSLAGIALFLINGTLLRTGLFVLVSFAACGLLGDTFIHILPEMAEGAGEGFPTASLLILL